jgi:transcriptional regulator with XRE-family HTH domain
MNAETFGQALHRLRGQLSVRGLARRAHCSKSHIWDLEQGNRRPTPGVARALDAALSAEGALVSPAESTAKPDIGLLGDRAESGAVEGFTMADASFATPARPAGQSAFDCPHPGRQAAPTRRFGHFLAQTARPWSDQLLRRRDDRSDAQASERPCHV